MKKIEYLAMSLPYGLKIKDSFSTPNLTGIMDNEYHFGSYLSIDGVEEIKPILRPLSDLTKEIEHKGETFVPIVKLLKNGFFDTSKMLEKEIMSFVKVYSYIDLIALNDLPLYLQWHFDLFGGIESGEAIDVNTLDINPYK